MGARRLTLSRVAGIAAWTTASVTWGTAAVAMSAPTPNVPEAAPDPSQSTTTTTQEALPAIPTMPESGLIVLRYTPVERDQPRVVVRTIPAPTASPTPSSVATQPAAPAPAAPAQPAPPVKEQSSGS